MSSTSSSSSSQELPSTKITFGPGRFPQLRNRVDKEIIQALKSIPHSKAGQLEAEGCLDSLVLSHLSDCPQSLSLLLLTVVLGNSHPFA